MLVLLTLSLLQPGDHNNTSDLASHVYAMALNASGVQPKKLFNMLLNDTGSTATKDVLKKENIYYNTPPQAITHRLKQHLKEKHKKHPSKLGLSADLLETKATSEKIQLSSKLDSRPHKNHKLHKGRMSTKMYNTPPNTIKEKLAQTLTTLQTDNVYYNTPPVVTGVDNGPIIKKHYGKKKSVAGRKEVTRYILRRYKNVQNYTHRGHMRRSRIPKVKLVTSPNITDTSASREIPQSNDIFHNQAQRKEDYPKNKTISKKHFRISPSFIKTTTSPVEVLQMNKSIINTSNKNRVSHNNSELRQQFDEPIIEKSTFAPISILLGDETLPDLPRLGQGAFGELEDTKVFSVPSKFITSSSLAPGDVLYGLVLTGQSTQEPLMEAYYKKMEKNNIGYLSVAFEDLCEHLASMKPKHVTEIMEHTEIVVRELQATGRLQWLGQPMTLILRDLSIVLAGEPADELQLRAMILKSLMRDRRKIVGTDVNKVLDFADDLITKKDGYHLLTVMQDVKQFPNVNKTGKELCTDIIKGFETPFLHLTGTTALQHMVKSANKAFTDRFLQYSEGRKGKGRVMKTQKSKQALNQPSKDKKSSKDKHPSKASSKDRPHSKETHTSKDKGFSKHKRPPKDEGLPKDKRPPKDEGLPKDKHPSKDNNTRTSKSKKPSRSQSHLHKPKYYPKYGTITPRRYKFIKPDFLLGVK